jgi:hypothetical protein
MERLLGFPTRLTYDLSMARTWTDWIRVIAIALVAALSGWLVAYRAFLWAFIRYWEWKCTGRGYLFCHSGSRVDACDGATAAVQLEGVF